MEQKGKTWKEEEEEATDGGDKVIRRPWENYQMRIEGRGKVGKE